MIAVPARETTVAPTRDDETAVDPTASGDSFAGYIPSSELQKALTAAVSLLGGSERPGQAAMAAAVERTLHSGGKLAVQAGTGTGKSLGYLLPALLYCLHEDARVVISTATLALQSQIITKDAPLAVEAVQNVTGSALRVEVLKGWQNYVCLHKLNGGYEGSEDDLFSTMEDSPFSGIAGSGETTAGPGARTTRQMQGFAAETKRLYEWARETTTGDRDEAPRGITARAWRQVSLSSLECVGEKCPFRSECFQVSARDKAAQAQIVVTNHAMIGLEAAGKQNPLPPCEAIIIDEAHELSERVRSQASTEFSANMLASCAKAAASLGVSGSEELAQQAIMLGVALQNLEDSRFTEMPAAVAECRMLALSPLKTALTELSAKAGADTESTGGQRADAAKIAVAKAALTSLLDTLETMTPESVANGETILWLTRGRDGDQEPRLYTAPLDVAGKLANRLWNEHAIIATSATLKLGGTFAPLMHKMGLQLDTPKPETLDVGSPFRHDRQGILYLARDLPAPTRGEHPDVFWNRLVDLVEASGGGALGLFSSRKMAERAGEVLRERTDLPIMVQGEDSMAALVKDMREDASACLMGTLSLWQGVDLPGNTCRLVLIDRIPFPVPSDPVIEARCDAVKRAGGSDFMEVSLTHAALLLAQGTGRLLRSATDRGVVAVLDSRLATARYGGFLRASLPPLWPTEDAQVVLDALRRLQKQVP
ncbi:ATP-dependent DNA helicase [Mobiluncus curtisii]|uniref:ATP-dependent DNA helicase n=1 Tax=Mobiluncus curtisii TaxID=2051 RepID=UPI0001E0D173|nr:ATP-dependent DNA helicase [Mobiluncus curtisii]EFL94391.1 hypothetical protein HMPREF0574_0342 [Mobiluncus curtisii subsp. curtisii ATCC 35241]NMW89178.1 ATP-dependent DNA helicase [Mobiluncus curtisii]QQT13152.1 ATP-dependent DNA helicase [Mobiluncus curtisii]